MEGFENREVFRAARPGHLPVFRKGWTFTTQSL